MPPKLDVTSYELHYTWVGWFTYVIGTDLNLHVHRSDPTTTLNVCVWIVRLEVGSVLYDRITYLKVSRVESPFFLFLFLPPSVELLSLYQTSSG